MRTNVVLDDELLEQVKEFTGEKTIRGALEVAMSEYVKYCLRKRFLELGGNIDYPADYDPEADDDEPEIWSAK